MEDQKLTSDVTFPSPGGKSLFGPIMHFRILQKSFKALLLSNPLALRYAGRLRLGMYLYWHWCLRPCIVESKANSGERRRSFVDEGKTRSDRLELYAEYKCRLSHQADFLEGDDTKTGYITSVSIQGIAVRSYPANASPQHRLASPGPDDPGTQVPLQPHIAFPNSPIPPPTPRRIQVQLGKMFIKWGSDHGSLFCPRVCSQG